MRTIPSLFVSLVLVLLFGSAARADSLDVPGSIPGTTTVFASDGGITVGTYQFQIGTVTGLDGQYGFIYDGTLYQTFVPGYVGAPPAAGTFLVTSISPVSAYDQVDILSFNKTGGIGYFVYNPLNGEDVICCGWVNSGFQNDFGTETDLRTLMDDPSNAYVTAPDGEQVRQLYDTFSYPTYINSEGQVVGTFDNAVTGGGCGAFVLTCTGQFLLSDGSLYLNYTTEDYAPGSFGGVPPNEQVVGFEEEGKTGIYTVPEPSSLLLFGAGILFLGVTLRRKMLGAWE